MKSKHINLSTEDERQKFYSTHPIWATAVAEYVSKVANQKTKIWFRETTVHAILYMEDIVSGTTVTRKMPKNAQDRTTRNPQ